MNHPITLLALPLLLCAGIASAQVTGGGVTGGGGNGGSTPTVGGLSSDFGSSTTPAGNASNKGGLGPALERVFGTTDQSVDNECARLGKCEE